MTMMPRSADRRWPQPNGQDFEIGEARELIHGGERLRLFEFRDPAVTGTPERVLIVADEWDVLIIAEDYPRNWRELSVEDLPSHLLPRIRGDLRSPR